jgi:hypothetical protein
MLDGMEDDEDMDGMDAEEGKVAEPRPMGTIDEEMIKRAIAEAVMKCMGENKAAEDAESEEERAKAEAERKKAEMETAKDKEEYPTKGAMDAAIASAVAKAKTETVAKMAAIETAKDHVREHVGKLAGAFDSAEGVYTFALKQMGVDTTGIHPTALRAVYAAQPKPGASNTTKTIAADASSASGFHGRFPAAHHIRHI